MRSPHFILPIAIAMALLSACSSPTDTMPASDTSDTTIEKAPLTEYEGVTLLTGKHTVVMKTSLGDITMVLDADKAPVTVTNFVTHAQNGYYDGLIFHRVIKDFMIQGGDPSGNGTGGESIYDAEFVDEFNELPMVRGALAMANRGPRTNGSQFFIVDAERTPWLEGKHTVFGNVTEGMDVLNKISEVEVGPGDKPVEAVTFSVEVQ